MSKENETKLFQGELVEIPEEPGDDFDWEEAAKKNYEFANEARGVAVRNNKDLGKLQEKLDGLENTERPTSPGTQPAPTPETKEGLDYGKLSYLESKGINERHHERLLKLEKETGMEMRELLSRDWVKKEIEELDAKEKTQKATPTGSKPAGTSSEGTVEYWLTKDKEEYPDDPELARKVATAREKQDQKQNKFTNNPVV